MLFPPCETFAFPYVEHGAINRTDCIAEKNETIPYFSNNFMDILSKIHSKHVIIIIQQNNIFAVWLLARKGVSLMDIEAIKTNIYAMVERSKNETLLYRIYISLELDKSREEESD